MTSSRIKTCYISAPLGVKVDHIRTDLVERTVRVLGAVSEFDFPTSIQTTLELIRQADLVIGVLGGDATLTVSARKNVLFELGIAAGLEKQIIIFAPAHGDLVPADLSGVLTVRTSLNNKEAISFALNQLFAAPDRNRGPTPTKQFDSGLTLGEASEQFLARSRDAIADRNESLLEQLIAESIRASGVDVVSESASPDRGIDLAVWADGLQQSVGNPLLIQIKRRLIHRQDVKRASDNLAMAVRNGGSTWGLLLYGEGPPSFERWHGNPSVLAISIPQLFNAMRTLSFVDIVRDLRNRRVHGVG